MDLRTLETQDNFNKRKSIIFTMETFNFSRNPFFPNDDTPWSENKIKTSTGIEHKSLRLLKRFVYNNFLQGKKATTKNIQNYTISFNPFCRTTDNKIDCIFFLDESSLLKARKILLDAKLDICLLLTSGRWHIFTSFKLRARLLGSLAICF